MTIPYIHGKSLFVALVLSISLLSCQKERLENKQESFNGYSDRLVEVTFNLAKLSETKTYRANGVNGWSHGDIIYYYGNHGLQLRTAEVLVDANENASVKLLFSPDDVEFVASYGAPILVGSTFDKEYIRLDTSAKMIKDGKFSTAQILVAKGRVDSPKLKFFNANGMIRFNTERSDVKYVYIFDNRGMSMDGKTLTLYNIDSTDNYREYYDQDGYTSVIQMTLDGSGEYYFLIPENMAYNYDSGTMSYDYDGLVFDFYDTKDEYLGSIVVDKKVHIKQNQILDLGNIDSHFQSLSEIYVLTEPFDPYGTPTYMDRKGNSIRVELLGNPNYGETTTYKTTIAVPPANLEDVYYHPEKISGVIVYSDEKGWPMGVETDNEMLSITYSQGGSKLAVTSIYRDDKTSEIKQTTYPEMDNPNFGASISYPVNYDNMRAYYPSEVFTPYKVISPLLNILSLFDGRGMIKGINAGLVAAEMDSSVFARPENALMISMVGFGLAAGAALTAPGFITTTLLAIAASDFISNWVSTLQQEIIEMNLRNAIPVTLEAEILNDTEVRLHCAVSEYIKAYIGVMISDGNSSMIAHNHNMERQKTVVQEGQQEYSFTFSDLQPNKKYKYRAYLTTNDAGAFDLCKYGDVKTFYTMYGADMGQKTSNGKRIVWATCDLGASDIYRPGRVYEYEFERYGTQRAEQLVYQAYGDGWRLPSEGEFAGLFSNDFTLEKRNGCLVMRFKNNGSNQVIVPLRGYDPYPDWQGHWICGGAPYETSFLVNISTYGFTLKNNFYYNSRGMLVGHDDCENYNGFVGYYYRAVHDCSIRAVREVD